MLHEPVHGRQVAHTADAVHNMISSAMQSESSTLRCLLSALQLCRLLCGQRACLERCK